MVETTYIVSVISFLTCLASLLSIWLVFGNLAFLIRAWLFVLGTLLLGCLTCVSIGEFEGEWLVMIALICGAVAAAVGLMRVFGLQIMQAADAADQESRRTFSMWQLLVMVTSMAGICGALRLMYDHMDLGLLRFSLVIAAALAAVGAASSWGILAKQAPGPAYRAVLVVGVSALAAMLIYYDMEMTRVDPGVIWAMIVAGHAGLLWVALWKLRGKGYVMTRAT